MAPVAPVGEDERRFTRLDHDERRSSILACARRAFCEKPYSEVKMSEIAESAGVARSLLHHYFGSKRELYFDVLREITTVPPLTVPLEDVEVSTDQLWGMAVELWMRFMETNRELWLTMIGAGGVGRDPEVDEILSASREMVARRALETLRLDPDSRPELVPLARAFGGLAEETTREWLDRRRLTRAQAHAVLLGALPLLVERLLPALEAAAAAELEPAS